MGANDLLNKITERQTLMGTLYWLKFPLEQTFCGNTWGSAPTQVSILRASWLMLA